MSRILAQSVTADLCGRFFNLLLFVLLLPFILVMAAFQSRPSVTGGRFGAVAALRPQGDLKSRP